MNEHRLDFVRSSLCLLWLAPVAACGAEQLSHEPGFLSASVEVVDFGDVFIGTAQNRQVSLINRGEMDVTIEPPPEEVSGGAFRLTLAETVVRPNGEVILEVSFVPTEVVRYETTVRLTNDSYNQPELDVILRGQGRSSDPCFGLACDTPPASACISSDTAQHYLPLGSCADGLCSYESVAETCDDGCDFGSGRCKGDPCAGVACQTPPGQCFGAQGTCVNGACVYTALEDLPCTDGDPCTLDDKCQAGICRGTPRSCEPPVASQCVTSSTMRKYLPVGVCIANGTCDYPYVDVVCDFGCELGTCKDDPCAGGCDDGNPCTLDTCNPSTGCVHTPQDASCVSNSEKCPVGICVGGQCLPKADETCIATYDYDLCGDVDVPGLCTGAGQCVVREAPPQFQCEDCDGGLCLSCTPDPGLTFKTCIPIF